MSEVKKAVRRFKRQLGKKPLCFETVADIARIEGYAISFYGKEENPIIKKHNLVTYSEEVKAFTFRSKYERYVFVDSEETVQDKLYYLLHEIGHILLKHLDTSKFTADERLQDMQAEAVAYMILTSCKRKY